MPLTDLQLMAHLFRRAGFGARRDELEASLAKGYEATVDTLLHPEMVPAVEEDVLQRYFIDAKESFQLDGAQVGWVYRMINTQRPLEEKMALFWHGLFATGFNKCDDPRAASANVELSSVLAGTEKKPALHTTTASKHDDPGVDALYAAIVERGRAIR